MAARDHASFLAAVCANPDDDTTRLVFADWLDDHGDPDRAEFIRAQIERAALPEWDVRHTTLRLRERALLKANEKRWRADLPAVKGVTWGGFRRGFVAEANVSSFDTLKTAAAALSALPIESVRVRWPKRKDVGGVDPLPGVRELTVTGRLAANDDAARLAASPVLSTVRTLRVAEAALGEIGFRHLLGSPHLKQLAALRVPKNALGNAGVELLAAARSVPALTELDLSETGDYGRYSEDPVVDDEGAAALARWPGLARLRTLILDGNSLGRTGLRALLGSPHAVGLKRLDLRENALTNATVKAFLDAADGLELDALDVGANRFGDPGVAALAQADCLRSLKALHLDRCSFRKAGVAKLAAARFLPTLRVLNLSYNSLGPAGPGPLLAARPPHLHTLSLEYTDATAATVKSIADVAGSDTLLDLNLDENDLGDGGADALATATHLQNLVALNLTDVAFGPAAAKRFAASPLRRRLTELHGPYVVRPRPGDDDIPF